MKINREGKSKVLDTKELDLLLNYLPNKKHKLRNKRFYLFSKSDHEGQVKESIRSNQ